MKTYLIKYISPRLGECLDAQEANNILAAYDRHKEFHPNSFAVKIKRPSDGIWLQFNSTGNTIVRESV